MKFVLMQEILLHHIWQFRLYQSNGLQTLCGKNIQVLNPGNYNKNQGPDFLDARIMIGDALWAGHIELHIYTSHWNQHGHSADSNYANVILHVVWKQDKYVELPFPTLELHPYVAKTMLEKYARMQEKNGFIPCQPLLENLPPLVFEKTLERMLAERMEARSNQIIAKLKEENGDWQKIWLQLLAKTLGGKINGYSFEQVMASIPMRLLKRCQQDVQMSEALLFGQANMLNQPFKDDWPKSLQNTYAYYQSAYHIRPALVSMHFFRMRPASFPGLRMAILANYLSGKINQMDALFKATDIKQLRLLLPFNVSEYWQTHYRFDVQAKSKVVYSSEQLQYSCILNAVGPLLYAYGRCFNQPEYIERSIDFQEAIAAEKNSIVHSFEQVSMTVQSAAQSQGLLQLYHEYCEKKNCMQCGIGLSILKRCEFG